MDTAEKIYEYIINNEIIAKDYFLNYDEENGNYTLEKLFHTFINDSLLADTVKMKLLKVLNKTEKRTVYDYFNLVQTNFNILMYDMKV